MEAKLYVGNLAYDATEQTLRQTFWAGGKCGLGGSDQGTGDQPVEGICLHRNGLPGQRPESHQHVQWL